MDTHNVLDAASNLLVAATRAATDNHAPPCFGLRLVLASTLHVVNKKSFSSSKGKVGKDLEVDKLEQNVTRRKHNEISSYEQIQRLDALAQYLLMGGTHNKR